MASPLARLRASVLHPVQLGLALAIGAIDGADIGSMGLALSRLSRELSLSARDAGICASASLVGLLIGAIVGGRLADRIGRGPALASSAMILGIFSLTTAAAWNFESLVVARLLTGLGIGGVVPIVIAVAHDAVVPRWRSTAVGIVMASGPLGGALMAFVAMAPDWRWIFYVGGIVPILLAFLTWRVGVSGPVPGAARQAAAPAMAKVLFDGGRGLNTLLIWIIALTTAFANYLMLNWMPSLLVLQGLSENQSHLGAACYSVGGVCGNVLAGMAVDRGRPGTTYIVGYIGAALVMAGFSLIGGALGLMMLAFLAAFFIIGAQLVTFALGAALYPDIMRATGLGVLTAVGRSGAIAGPLVAGYLLHAGFSAQAVLLVLAPVFGAALIFGLILVARRRRSWADRSSGLRSAAAH